MLSEVMGGIQATVVPYAMALQQGGHEVSAFLSTTSPVVGQVAALGVETVTFDILTSDRARKKALVLELREKLRQFGPEVIIAFAGLGLPLVLRATPELAPIISRCGNLSSDLVRPLLPADHLIATSEEMRLVLIAEGARPRNVSVIPNFFPGEAVPRDYCARDVVRIGALGRLLRLKGFGDLIEALGALHAQGLRFEATIVGHGPHSAEFAEMARATGAPITIGGWVDGAEKDRFLRDLDILVVPSRQEPFGNVFIEGMQYGLPIVTTLTVGASAIFGDKPFVPTVPTRAPKALANAIGSLANDPGARAQIGQLGQELWSRSYAFDKSAPKLVSVVEEVRARWIGRK